MRLLFLGDIVGRTARQAVMAEAGALRSELELDFLIVNCENAAGGFGVTPAICDDLLAAGVDVLTTGNHVWDKGEISPYLDRTDKVIRPANMGNEFPGVGMVRVENAAGKSLIVINLIATLFMADNDNPFLMADKILAKCSLGTSADAIMVDFHGEATSEKTAMGHHLDGRVSMVVGTHTHVPTADHRVLPGGTAFQTDAGMCGDYNSVIGMDAKVATGRFSKQASGRLSVALGEASLCGLLVELDDTTGLAISAEPFRRGGMLSATHG